MYRDTTVNLNSNGRYWQAVYRDRAGRRRARSLGSKADVSRRQAKKMCDQLAAELQINPGRRDAGRAPTLAAWTEAFLNQKKNLVADSQRAYRLASRKLREYLGEEIRLDQVTPHDAAQWRASLLGGGLSENTVASYCRHVRCIFNGAVNQEIIFRNPLVKVSTQAKTIDRDWHYVDHPTMKVILDACPNHSWASFIALQRFGALRKSESLRIRWAMINWRQRILRLPGDCTKTGKERIIPLGPRLLATLREGREAAAEDETYVISSREVDKRSTSNQHARFRRILEARGIQPWKDLFQTLRRNAVQDLREKLKDPWAVTAIAGHSEEVERKYYLGHIRSSDIAKISGVGMDRQLDEVKAAWSELSKDQRLRVVRFVRRATKRHRTEAE